MAARSAATIREYIRHVYRQSAALGVSASAYLDTISEVALKAQREGKTVNASATGTTSVSWTVFQAFKPDDILDLIDLLRGPCAEANVTLALAKAAELAIGVRSYRTDFSLGRAL